MLPVVLSRCSRRAGASVIRHAWSLTEALGLHKGSEPVDVYAIDPRTVLQPVKLREVDLEKAAALFTVNRDTLPMLSKGVSELAEMDEPGNAWYFGDRAEIFDYRLVGEFPTQSGYTSFIHREVLERIRAGDAKEAKSLPSWQEFLDLTSDTVKWPHRKTPFLFAGRMVETHMAALYTLQREGKTVGVLVSSESSGGGDDD